MNGDDVNSKQSTVTRNQQVSSSFDRSGASASVMSEGERPEGSIRPEVSAPRHTKIITNKPWGTWAFGLLVLVALVFIVRAFAVADIHYSLVAKYFADPQILAGVGNTLKLTLLAMVIGLVLGVIAAVMQQSGNFVLKAVAGGYVWLFRGTPLLVQLLIWFNLSLIFKYIEIPGLFFARTNQVMTPFLAALLALGVNEGSYVAEIVRGGILAVDSGQREASAALGMRSGATMRRVILPQAMRVIVPPLGNEFISLLKYSSLAYTIAYTELLQSANRIYTANFMVIELLFTVSLWYLLLTTVFTVLQQVLERWLGKGYSATAGHRPRRFGKKLLSNIFGGRG